MDEKRALESIQRHGARSLGRQLLFWTIRWIIGFTIIHFVTQRWPSASWLWWAAGIVATLSLIALPVAHFALQRKIAQAQWTLQEADRLAETMRDPDEASSR